ncbi:site-specific integrase [Nocardia testacea]|uniref:site-specific integrase n=1 Tax=Nocardia testacea TaxID=248551 RepID=UPI00030BAE8B|nr:tyrosine-type recombinase/integrase [Nocardia testacea]
MPRIRGEGKPYKERRTKTVVDKKTGEKKVVETFLWAWRVELDRKPNGDRDYTVVRRKNRNDLIEARRELLVKIATGQPLKQSSATIAAFLEYWLEEIAKPRLRPRPWRNHVSTVNCNIVPHIGKVKLVDLEPQNVRYMVKQILASGLSLRTAEIAYNTLSGALEDAMKEPSLGLTRNVAKAVPKPGARTTVVQTTMVQGGAVAELPAAAGELESAGPKKRKQRSRAPLTSEQARAVIRHALDTENPLAVRFAFALLTGVRQGECLGLTADRVDLDRGLVDLSWALQAVPLKRKKGDPLPKGDVYPLEAFDSPAGFEVKPLFRSYCLIRPKTTKSVRMLPLPDPLLMLLRAHIQQMKPNPYGLLWVTDRGRPYSSKADTAEWTAALAAVGAPDVVQHAARHTTATLLLEAKVPEDVRMAIMGHSSAAVQRMYAHADHGVKRAGLSALGGLLAEKKQEEPPEEELPALAS